MTDEDAILAGELALGVLEGEERADALRRQLAEPAFAALVLRWREHFALFHAETTAVDAPESVYQRVMATVTGRGPVTARWRATAAVASLIAASLAMVLVLRPAQVRAPVPAARPAVLVAALGGSGATAPEKPIGALYDPGAGHIVLVGGAPVPDARSAELWVIAAGKPPRPLGLIGRGDRAQVRVAGALRADLAAGATLAISIEPVGGSPTGLPTGPVIATGLLAAT